jgi:hypothetical protein
MTNFTAAIFYLDSGTTYICRDSEYIGAVTAGSAQTFASLTIAVISGDYMGGHEVATGGYVEKSTTGYGGIMAVGGEYKDPTDSASYTLASGDALSIYGTGTEAGGTYDITNSPSTKAFGIVANSSTNYAKGSAPSNPVVDGDCTFTLTSTGDSTTDVDIHGHAVTGGVGATLTSGAPGENTVRFTFYKTGDNPANGVILTTSDQEFYSNLASSGHFHFDFKFEMGTATDATEKTEIVTLTGRAP